MNRYH